MVKELLFLSPGYPTKEDPHYTFVEQLCVAMVKEGINVTVIAPQSLSRHIFHHIPKHPVETCVIYNDATLRVYQPYYVSVSGVEKLTGYFYKKAVDNVIDKLSVKPDVCYAHFWGTGFALYDYCKRFFIPLFVATGEGNLFGHKRSFAQKGFTDYTDYVKGVICVSTKNMNDSIKMGLTTKDKCEVFPNSTDTQMFCVKDRVALRKKYNMPEDSFIVAFVGSFDERKGPDRVAAAINKVDEDIKSFFIGKMHKNNIHVPSCEGILYKGTVSHSQLSDYLNMADVFVLPTQNEGCCNAIVEAICCGLPIISSNKPFNYDILDESNSLLVDPNSVDEIASAIKLIKDDKLLYTRLAKGAIEKAESLTISNRAKKIINFINSKM